ncbi:MAG: Rne/Rng family ribonuclease [Pseudomonadota bacterium]|nr:Rne/Rng family ribonuclease [Pseudomonadota bacterium]
MSEEVLINVTSRETRVAMVENGILQEVVIERNSKRGLVSNIYKGKVCRVLPGMQAAFVDIGLERAAFLHVSDIVNFNNGDAEEGNHSKNDSIYQLLYEGQTLLVQVIKDPLGTKGARLTTQISIPSRYAVLTPFSYTIGISARIETTEERKRLKDIALRYVGMADESEEEEPLPETMMVTHDNEFQEESTWPVAHFKPCHSSTAGERCIQYGFIIRTAAEGVFETMLQADMDFLCRLWKDIQEKAAQAPDKSLIYSDFSLSVRAIRDLIGTTVEKVRVDSKQTFQEIVDFAQKFIPDLVPHIEYYAGQRPIFDLYSIEDEINKALERKVYLKSGGYLVIDQTEAMTTIDVNTGAYVGSRNLEETIFKTNLEAAQAIARQLRLRNLGGIIIVDFIDMLDGEHKRQVLRTLEKCLERDHTKTHISEVSSLGLVQMTRKRTRESLEHVLCETCPTCNGRGSIKTAETMCYEIFREIWREAQQFDTHKFLIIASPEVVDLMLDEESSNVAELEEAINRSIKFRVETSYSQEQYDIVLMQ